MEKLVDALGNPVRADAWYRAVEGAAAGGVRVGRSRLYAGGSREVAALPTLMVPHQDVLADPLVLDRLRAERRRDSRERLYAQRKRQLEQVEQDRAEAQRAAERETAERRAEQREQLMRRGW